MNYHATMIIQRVALSRNMHMKENQVTYAYEGKPDQSEERAGKKLGPKFMRRCNTGSISERRLSTAVRQCKKLPDT